MKLYAVATLVRQPTCTGEIAITSATMGAASTPEEMEGKALRWLSEKYPPAEGWYGHGVAYVEQDIDKVQGWIDMVRASEE